MTVFGSVTVVHSVAGMGVAVILLPLVAVAVILLWRAWRKPAAPRTAWPWYFVLFYVVPVGAMLLGSLSVALHGGVPWAINGAPAVLVLGSIWISSLLAFLSLVMAARVRAAWQRARASGAL
jgi:hypothetical protein